MSPLGLLLTLGLVEAALFVPPLLVCRAACRRAAKDDGGVDSGPDPGGGDIVTAEPTDPLLVVATPKEATHNTALRILGWLLYTLLMVSIAVAILVVLLLWPEASGAAPDEPAAPRTPPAPRIANKTADSLILSWTSPDAGTAPINAYELQQTTAKAGRAADFSTIWKALGTSLRLGDLLANTTYCFRLRACNVVGCSPFCTPACAATEPATPPPAPSALWPLNTSASSITITWAPSQSHGIRIHSYEVQFTKAARPISYLSACNVSLDSTDSASQRRCITDHLTSNTTFRWRVRAVNAAGVGLWSTARLVHTDCANARAPPAPAVPPSLEGRTADTLTFAWDAWEDGGAEVLSYGVSVTAAGMQPWIVENVLEQRLTAESLKSATRYCFAVRATNSIGTGLFGPAGCSRTGTPEPPAPPLLQPQPLSIGSDTVTVQWEAALREDPVKFELQRTNWWDDRPFFTIYVGTATEFTEVGPLLPATAYAFRVRAGNAAGWGNWSTTVSFTTNEAGSCGNAHDVLAYKNTKHTMKGDIQYCLLHCIRSESCATTCMSDRVGLSQACGHCWVDEGHCTMLQCLLPCMSPDSDACKACSQAKCFPQCVKCSGVAVIYFPP